MKRIENIKKIIDEGFNGSQTAFAKAIKKSPAQVNQWLNGRRNVGNGIAVEIEKILGLPIGSLDLDENNQFLNIVNHGAIGTQNNVSGNQHNFFQHDTAVAQAQAMLGDKDAKFLIAMPLLSIDKGVEYVIYPDKKEELIRGHAERASIYMPHSDSTFAVKVPDNSLKEIADICANDIVVIEPKMRPANNDLVLVCLDYKQPSQRGLLAKLFVDLANHHTIQYSPTTPAQALPPNALICGVYTETKRRPFSNDIIASRINPDWDIFNTLQKSA